MDSKGGIVGHKTHKPGSSGLVQVVVSLAVVLAAAAGAGHASAPGPQPPTVCTELRVPVEVAS